MNWSKKGLLCGLLALLLGLPLAGCKPKEMPMGDFALDITPKQTIDIPTGGQGARTLDYLELEVDIPREIPMILPQVKGITAAVTPPAYVDAEIRDGVLVLTGRSAAEGVVLDITLSAPGYEDGAYQFMARVSLHPMELRILGPVETEDVQLDDPLEITQGDVVTLPLSFEEGAAVEISDRTGDEAVEAVIRDGSLVLTALEAGEARLSLCATRIARSMNCPFSVYEAAVDPAYGGKGYGKELVLKAVDFARKQDIKIIPLCPFAKKVFDKDPDIQDVRF